MTSTPFTPTISEFSKYDFGDISTKTVYFDDLDSHDELPDFEFAPLDELKKDLINSGHPLDEVESVIAGLSELPQYDRGSRNRKSKRSA